MSEETVQQMRETIERMQKATAADAKTITDQAVEIRVRDAREAFRTQGLNPRHGDLFASQEPDTDINAETVTAFAEAWNLKAEEKIDSDSDDGEKTSEVTDGSEGLSSMSGGGSQSEGGVPSGDEIELMPRQEWIQLSITDPARAKQIATSGRVAISADNPYQKSPRQAPSGQNPYINFGTDSE